MDGFEVSSGIFPLVCATALPSAQTAMHELTANAATHCTPRAQVPRTVAASNDVILLCSLRGMTASFQGLIKFASFCLGVVPEASVKTPGANRARLSARAFGR